MAGSGSIGRERASLNDVDTDRVLGDRYGLDALTVLDDEDRRRLLDAHGRPRDPGQLPWELLYRLEPALYDRLVAGECLHPAILQWLPRDCRRVLELGAGTGRLTLDLAARYKTLTATDPVPQCLSILSNKLAAAGRSDVEVRRAFFDDVPVARSSCDLVISCSAFIPAAEQDPEACLNEMRRCCSSGGLIVVVWPNGLPWFERHGFTRVEFPGPMAIRFGSIAEALELTRIFYPEALEDIRRLNSATVPYEMLGKNAPRDLCWLRVE